MITGTIRRFSALGLLLLVACARGGADDPAVVLERASSIAHQLQSSAFDVAFTYTTAGSAVKIDGTAEGVMADAGNQLSFSVDAAITMPTNGLDQTVETQGDIVVMGEGEAYVRVQRADGSVLFLPGIGLIPSDMLDRWIRIGNGSGSGSVGLTPDPSFIGLQTEALLVTEDRSYERIDGRDCYAYDVSLVRSKALAYFERIATERNEPFDRVAAEAFLDSYLATGTIWIDDETSVIRRILWTFAGSGEAEGTIVTFDLHLYDHNEPVTIIAPTGATNVNDLMPSTSLPIL